MQEHGQRAGKPGVCCTHRAGTQALPAENLEPEGLSQSLPLLPPSPSTVTHPEAMLQEERGTDLEAARGQGEGKFKQGSQREAVVPLPSPTYSLCSFCSFCSCLCHTLRTLLSLQMHPIPSLAPPSFLSMLHSSLLLEPCSGFRGSLVLCLRSGMWMSMCAHGWQSINI